MQPNDLEAPAVALQPVIADVLTALRGLAGCRLARMSGSGATVLAFLPPLRTRTPRTKILCDKNPNWWAKAHVGRRYLDIVRALVCPRDAEIDCFRQRRFHRRVGEQRQRIAGDRAVMVSAPDRVLERAVFGHKPDGVFEIGVSRLAAFERAPPELAFGVAAAAESEHHRQRDLSFAKVVADVFPELAAAPP